MSHRLSRITARPFAVLSIPLVVALASSVSLAFVACGGSGTTTDVGGALPGTGAPGLGDDRADGGGAAAPSKPGSGTSGGGTDAASPPPPSTKDAGSSSGDPPPPPVPSPPGPPVVTETCSQIAVTCKAGGPMSYCIEYSDNVCTGIVYKHDGATFPCASGCGTGGGGCTTAYAQANAACQDVVGACHDLATCCVSIQTPAYKTQCNNLYDQYVNGGGDVSCNALLRSYRQSSLCP